MERIFSHHNRKTFLPTCLQAIRWHLEKGWDEEYGGLFLARSCGDGKPVWHSPDSKVWWPMTESLYAVLRAYELTGEDWCLNWYWKLHAYAFRSFPNWEHGDWHQNLDRLGRPIPVVVASLPVKDPFHLPRALLYSLLVLRRL